MARDDEDRRLAQEALERAEASAKRWLANPDFRKDLQESHEKALQQPYDGNDTSRRLVG